MGKLFINIYNYFQARKILFLILLLIVLLSSAYFGSKLQFEEDISKMMPSDKQIDDFNYALSHIKFLDKLVIKVSFSIEEKKSSPEILIQCAEEFSDSLKTKLVPKYIDSINLKISNDFFNQTYQVFLDNLPIFLDSLDYLRINQILSKSEIDEQIKRHYNSLMSPAGMVMRKFLLNDPLSIAATALKKMESLNVDDNINLVDGYLVTKNNRNLIFMVYPSHHSAETSQNAEMIRELDEIIKEITNRYNNKVVIDYFGASAVAVGNAERIKSDVILTITIALLAIFIVITYFYRSAIFFPIATIPFIFGSIIAIALLYFIKGDISAISLGIGAILLGESVDFALYIFTLYRNNSNNVSKVIEDISTPIIMGCLTTAAAFLCLVFMSSDALGDLGLFATFSITFSALFSLLVIPHLLKFLFKKKSNFFGNFGIKSNLNLFDKASTLKPDSHKWIVLAVVGFTIFFSFFGKDVEFDSDINNMNYLSKKLQTSQEELNKITSLSFKTIILVSKGADFDEALRKSHNLDNKLMKLKETGVIGNFSSASSIIPDESVRKDRIQLWKSFWTEEKKDNLKKNITNSSLVYGFKKDAFDGFFTLLNKQKFDISNKEIAEKLNLLSLGLVSFSENHTLLPTNIKVNPNRVQEFYSIISKENDFIILDKSFLTNKFIEIIKSDFEKLILFSLLVVFIILLISFGRFELAIITIIPILISWVWTLGIMGLFGIKFTIFNIIVSTISFGMGVDYSLFIVKGLLQEYQYAKENLNSYKASILLSSITTMSGMGAMIFAEHPSLQSIAILSLIGISTDRKSVV